MSDIDSNLRDIARNGWPVCEEAADRIIELENALGAAHNRSTEYAENFILEKEKSAELLATLEELNATMWRCIDASLIEGTPVEDASIKASAVIAKAQS